MENPPPPLSPPNEIPDESSSAVDKEMRLKCRNRKGYWWLGAILAPFLIFGIAFICFLGWPTQSGVMDLGGLIPLFFGLVAGSFSSFVLAAISFIKGESRSDVALWFELFLLLFLFWCFKDLVNGFFSS
jgi:hypothetical protein